MAKAKKQSSRGRKQDRARVAGGQDYEVRYTAKKTKKSAGAVKKAVKKVGSSRSGSNAGSDVRNAVQGWIEAMSHLLRMRHLSPGRASAVPLEALRAFRIGVCITQRSRGRLQSG
jgi:hypothetical protein